VLFKPNTWGEAARAGIEQAGAGKVGFAICLLVVRNNSFEII
jgi:hypothetical protein